MQRWISIIAAVCTIASSACLAAEAEVREALAKMAPAGKIESIAPATIPGFQETVVDGQIIYVSDDGSSLLVGELWRVESQQNVTALRKNALRREAMETAGSERRIDFAADAPKYTVTVFTDFDCGYCQRLHHDIAEYNARGISIEYLLFPRGGLNSPSFEKAVSVWCAADRKSAFTDAKAGKAPAPATCPNEIAENYALGARVGVTGTPTMIDSSGGTIGYLPPAQMLARLEGAK